MSIPVPEFFNSLLEQDVADRGNAVEPGALTAMLNYDCVIPCANGLGKKRGVPLIEVPTLMPRGERAIALGQI